MMLNQTKPRNGPGGEAEKGTPKEILLPVNANQLI
jgi:hypothetical protein